MFKLRLKSPLITSFLITFSSTATSVALLAASPKTLNWYLPGEIMSFSTTALPSSPASAWAVTHALVKSTPAPANSLRTPTLRFFTPVAVTVNYP